ncbi:MAG: WXG100 family type VII secretion target [Lachnospiraceae bacterium]|nr:WXG100 family type VII secretion target [Lachnospiraceae bacterium]
MAEFQVTATTLKEKAEELKSLNTDFASKVDDLVSTQQTLSGMWEGESRDAFDSAFNTDRNKWDLFKSTVDEYYSRLLTIIARYEQAESKNVGIATTRNS